MKYAIFILAWNSLLMRARPIVTQPDLTFKINSTKIKYIKNLPSVNKKIND